MISRSMVSGQIIVKATKTEIKDDSYYFEFTLTESQTQQLIAELLVEHVKNNTLIVKHERSDDTFKQRIEVLQELLDREDLTPETKNSIAQTIIKLTAT